MNDRCPNGPEVVKQFTLLVQSLDWNPRIRACVSRTARNLTEMTVAIAHSVGDQLDYAGLAGTVLPDPSSGSCKEIALKEYMVIPFNPQLNEKEVSSGGAKKLADLLQGEINKGASMGWAFKDYETIAVSINPGCLAIFGGKGATTVNYGTIIFERDTGR